MNSEWYILFRFLDNQSALVILSISLLLPAIILAIWLSVPSLSVLLYRPDSSD
jgi:hypothetical protein